MDLWKALGHCGSMESPGALWICGGPWGIESQREWPEVSNDYGNEPASEVCWRRVGGSEPALPKDNTLRGRKYSSAEPMHPIIHYIKFMVCLDSSGTTNKRRKKKRSGKGWRLTLGQSLQSPFPGSLWLC